MSLSTRQHNAIALIVFCALLVFFRLNSAPMQPMETLLAFKADLILQFNGFFDLAPYFTGAGNAQFAMPPMGIWLTALAMKIMGNLPLHLRIPSVLCSAAALALIYQIARRLVGYQLALIAPVLLASTLTWNMFARQAGTDIPSAMFVLLSLWTLIMLGEVQPQPSRIGTLVRFAGYSALYAISIAGSFLSGFFAGGIAVLMLAVMIPYLRKKDRIGAGIGLVTGITVAGLWYNLVYLSIPGIFADGISVGAMFQTFISGLLAQPYLVFAAVAPVLIIMVNSQSPSPRKYRSVEYSLLLWFVLAIFSGGLTNSEFFTESSSIILLAPVAVLLAVRGFELTGSSPQNVRLMWVMIVAVSVAFICSFSEGAQSSAASIFHPTGNLFGALIPLIAILTVISVGFILPKSRLYQITARLTLWVGIIIPSILILRIAVLNISKPDTTTQSKQEASNYNKEIFKEKNGVLSRNEGKIWRER